MHIVKATVPCVGAACDTNSPARTCGWSVYWAGLEAEVEATAAVALPGPPVAPGMYIQRGLRQG